MAAGATETGGVSWGGIRWIKSGNGVAERNVANGTEVLSADPATGRVTVGVKNSEAVLLGMLSD